jgi:hypothetical protein
MIPKIIRVHKGWAAGTKENGYDLCDTFWIALRYLRRVGLDEYLINALYFACKKLKEEKSI